VDAEQKVNAIVCDIFNDPSFTPAGTVGIDYPELKGDPRKCAVYPGTNVLVAPMYWYQCIETSPS